MSARASVGGVAVLFDQSGVQRGDRAEREVGVSTVVRSEDEWRELTAEHDWSWAS
jgi:hypothetical protein